MGIGDLNRAAIFLDRDGVLNELVLNPATGRMESPLQPEDLRLIDGAIPALMRLQRAGYPLVLVSNQPNFALGKSTLDALGAVHCRLESELIAAGVQFARFSYCLHHPQGVVAGYSGLCVCRKPSPWFLLRARDDFGYSLRDSWMIGDQPTDTQCGRAAGVRTIRVNSGSFTAERSAAPAADYMVWQLSEAAEIILTHRPGAARGH
ncbi:MAG TPA: HAD-IIIA family hydrolase [Acidobacteriaceae bacterium]|nr:HAD-IIIA family hydrolase [Acidobacteriaceae bacterium]